MVSNDLLCIEGILANCDDVVNAMKRFSITEEMINNDSDMRALMAFFVLQIGEIANKLSSEFKQDHPEIEWALIIGFRHHIVHAYGHVIPAILWDTISEDIPVLRSFCQRILSDQHEVERSLAAA